jgi:hypothetical protein
MEISAAKWKYSDLIRVLFIIECSRSPENERRKTKSQNGKTAERQKWNCFPIICSLM